MKSRITLFAIMLIMVAFSKSFGAFPVKYISGVNTGQPVDNIAANYESEKAALFPYTQKYKFSNPQKCLVSKIGRGTMIAGGGVFVIGSLIGFTKTDEDSDWGLSTRATWIGLSFLLGAFIVVIGCLLAIGGGIYNMTNSRYSLVTDKKNETGIAYNF
ncbi:MAG: hypothetical protein JWQ38_3754 [Flavipsychrobacter sp.]|nr:hypothetical protein [Flavipsychrobacter sp.]